MPYFGRVRRIGTDGIITTIAGNGSASAAVSGPASEVRFFVETNIALDAKGLYVTSVASGSGGRIPHIVGKIDVGGGFTVIAGSERGGYAGDGGPALGALFFQPRGLAVDGSGNIFVADSGNNVVRRVGADGTITTVAGTGQRGFSGDRGPAARAQLFAPVAVAISPDGAVYIADTYNHCVRKVDAGGTITTVVGSGTAGYSGEGGPAADAQANEPRGLFVDAKGGLYIADSVNNRVRFISPTGIITSVAGDGGAKELSSPSAVVVAGDGAIYVADAGNHRIRRWVPAIGNQDRATGSPLSGRRGSKTRM